MELSADLEQTRPVTGKPVKAGGVAIWRIADGKVVEHWSYCDKLDLVRQMGATLNP